MLCLVGSIGILSGLALMIGVPIGIIPLDGMEILSIPGGLAAIFLATLLITFGVECIYFGWYRHYARELDN